MTDETRTDEARPQGDAAAAETGPAVATEPTETPETEPAEGEEQPKETLRQTVNIRDIGPCKKHITVTVEREAIDGRFNDKYKEIVTEGNVPGFRPGQGPRKVIERKFYKEVSEDVKREVMLASLEQLAEEHDLAPLSPPNLDPAKIILPREGPFIYEFEVEVRPAFDLPDYQGLKLRKPVRTFGDADVAREERRILAPHGQIVPKPEGNAQPGDILVSDLTTRDGDRVLSELKEFAVRIDPQLAFKDGIAERFAEQVTGANPGDKKLVDITLSTNVADPNLIQKHVQATFEVKEVKTVRLPELTHEFLHNFGVHSPDQFRELIHVVLQRRLEYFQLQQARQQVMEKLLVKTDWQLPQDLLARQARRAMARRVMEMKAEGISEEEIKGRQRVLEQDILRSTAQSLMEHFVLQKIAEEEDIDIDEDDINDEIERLAEHYNESPRRFRARLEKDDQIEALAAQIIERKALDRILEKAEWEEYSVGPQDDSAVTAVEQQAVPGEMTDPTAEKPAAEEEKPAEEKPAE